MEVGFALISLRQTPCPSGIPLPRERSLKNPLKNEVWNMLFGNRVTI